MTEIREGVVRTSVPLLFPDVVSVTNPDAIREICSSPEIGRPAEGGLPTVLDLFHYASKFLCPARKQFFVGFQTDNKNDQVPRREAVLKQLEKGFSDEQIAAFADLVDSDADMETLAVAAVKGVGSIILPLPDGEQVPDDIALAAYGTLTEVNDVFMPWRYLTARRKRLAVENYVGTFFPDDPYTVDYAHNLGAAAHGFAKALMFLRDTQELDSKAFFSKTPVAEKVLRCPLQETTLNGMFPTPLIPDKTFLSIDIAAALKETNDDLFFFGTGLPERQCPFRDLAFETLDKIQAKRALSQN